VFELHFVQGVGDLLILFLLRFGFFFFLVVDIRVFFVEPTVEHVGLLALW
jgi:hypothetical protein